MNPIFELFKRLFSSLFTTTPTTDKPNTTDSPKTQTPPEKEEQSSDSSELPKDAVIVTEVLPFEITPGEVVDDKPKDTPATSTPPATPKPPVVTVKSTKYMWCLDNGHGKATPGKRSAPFEMDGINLQFFEYEFNRDIVKRMIAAMTEKEIKFFNVVPEVEGDITLQERVRRANNLSSSLPKLYVSIHANAGSVRPGTDWSAANGIETWHFHASTRGRAMAAFFQEEIVKATGWRNRGLKSTAEKDLYVLRHTNMAAVLTENGFFNNLDEVKKLMRDDIRQAIADAHIAAIIEIERKGLA
jgi:N-acetylmuramoyl-L-alanine amidase